jgi:hypothetical protein
MVGIDRTGNGACMKKKWPQRILGELHAKVCDGLGMILNHEVTLLLR